MKNESPRDKFDGYYDPNSNGKGLGIALIVIAILCGCVVDYMHYPPETPIYVAASLIYFLLGIFVLIKSK